MAPLNSTRPNWFTATSLIDRVSTIVFKVISSSFLINYIWLQQSYKCKILQSPYFKVEGSDACGWHNCPSIDNATQPPLMKILSVTRLIEVFKSPIYASSDNLCEKRNSLQIDKMSVPCSASNSYQNQTKNSSTIRHKFSVELTERQPTILWLSNTKSNLPHILIPTLNANFLLLQRNIPTAHNTSYDEISELLIFKVPILNHFIQP